MRRSILTRKVMPLALAQVRAGQGFVLVEFLAGLLVVVPVLLLILDLAMIILGVQISDTACREAARAAASGDPRYATARATAVIKSTPGATAGLVSNLHLVKVSSTVTTAAVDKLVVYGGPVLGNVTVQTAIEVHPFLLQWAYSGQPLTFHSSQTFPFTYVFPNTASSLKLMSSANDCITATVRCTIMEGAEDIDRG
jgi:hypothetical protein